MIKLIFDAQGSRDNIKVRVENASREINFKIPIGDTQIILKSSVRPEWDNIMQDVLFLQGSDIEFENDFVEIPRKKLKYFLFAIWKHNGEQGAVWLDTHKFKCKHCKGIKSVTKFDQSFFEYCLDCISELKACADCKKLGASHIFQGKYYCDACVGIDTYCQMCEEEHKTTRELSFNTNGDYHGSEKFISVCSNCAAKPVNLGLELNYLYKPTYFNFMDYDFKKNVCVVHETPLNNKIYMGTEIEAEFDNKKSVNVVLGKVLKLNDAHEHEIIYAKHDGTIEDPGSEIVTHPLTLNMFRHVSWKKLFDNVIRPNTFGIGGHIHINKTAFVSPLHVYKFCKFIRTNCQYIEWIAERPLQKDWCKSYSDNGKVVEVAKRFKRHYNNDRYEMINFTQNTIELRFFWSPSNTGMLLKNVKFVDALYNYTRDVKMHFDYKEFESYVEDNCIKYPYLYNFILKRDGVNSFATNLESVGAHINTRSYEEFEIAPSRQFEICDWCDEEIEGEPTWYEGSSYHDSCYADMIYQNRSDDDDAEY